MYVVNIYIIIIRNRQPHATTIIAKQKLGLASHMEIRI